MQKTEVIAKATLQKERDATLSEGVRGIITNLRETQFNLEVWACFLFDLISELSWKPDLHIVLLNVLQTGC